MTYLGTLISNQSNTKDIRTLKKYLKYLKRMKPFWYCLPEYFFLKEMIRVKRQKKLRIEPGFNWNFILNYMVQQLQKESTVLIVHL